MRTIPSQGERLQVPHLKLVSRGNQGVITITCSYCHMAIVTKNTNVWLYPFFLFQRPCLGVIPFDLEWINIKKHLCVGAKPLYI
jgi:hypothetical protein